MKAAATHNQGFTLIEMIGAVSVIAIIFAGSMGMVMRSTDRLDESSANITIEEEYDRIRERLELLLPQTSMENLLVDVNGIWEPMTNYVGDTSQSFDRIQFTQVTGYSLGVGTTWGEPTEFSFSLASFPGPDGVDELSQGLDGLDNDSDGVSDDGVFQYQALLSLGGDVESNNLLGHHLVTPGFTVQALDDNLVRVRLCLAKRARKDSEPLIINRFFDITLKN